MHLITPTNIIDEGGPVTRATVASYWDRLGVLRVAPVNALRLTYDPLALGEAPYPLIEPAAGVKCLASNDALNTWAAYSTGTGAATVQLIADAQFGTFARITKTAGATADRAGVQAPIAGLSGGTFAIGAFLRGLAGMTATVAGFSAEVRSSSSTWAQNVGASIATVPSTPLPPTGSLAVWLDGPLGSFIDVKLPEVELGTALTSPVLLGAVGLPYTRAADVIGSAPGLLYSNLVESDASDGSLWTSTPAWPKDTYVRRPNHKIYRALQAVPANTIATPESNPNGSNSLPYWLEWAPTKRWAAFDTTLATGSTAPEVLHWIVRTGQVTTALAVLNADGADVRVAEVTGDGQLVYRKTKNLVLKTSRSLTDFLFKPIERRRDEVFDDLPPFKNGIVAITVTKPGSVASVGDIKLGRLEEIGDLLVEPEIRRLRRSTHKDDGYGRYKFTKRPSSKLLSCVVDIDARRTDSIVAIIDKYTDEPVVLIGDGRWTSLIILGFVQDFRLSLDSETGATYNLQAEGFG